MIESTRAGPFEMFPTPCVENLRRTMIGMARIWIDHLSPDVADDELRASLTKYGCPDAAEIERIGADDPRPAATIATSGLGALATHMHDLLWRGHALNVQVIR